MAEDRYELEVIVNDLTNRPPAVDTPDATAFFDRGTKDLYFTTGDRWTGLSAGGAGSQPPAFAPVNVIDPLDSGWSDTYSQGTITHDSSTSAFGSASLKMTAPTGTNLFGAKKDLAAAEDWSRSAFSIWVRSNDWSSITDYSVAVSTGGTGFGNFWNAELRPDVTPVREDDEWSQIVFTRGDFVVGAGTPDWADVQSVILRAYSATGETPTIWFDQFERYPVQDKGIVSIIFDDGYDDTYSTAKPILDEYGFRAGVAIVPGIIGDSGYLTQAEVDALALGGWDISGHGATNLTTVSEAAAESEVQAARAYLATGGYKGSDVYVYPNGGWNDTVKRVVSKYFTVARGTDQFLQTATYYPRLNLNGRQVGAAISPSTVNAEIDSAASSGTWLILVFHNIESSGASGVGYNEADFQTIVDHLATADVDVLTISEVVNWAPVAERPIETHSFTVGGEAAVASHGHRLVIEDGGQVVDVRATVGTAPTGADMIVDVNRNGTTIFTTQSNRPQIAAGSTTDISRTIENGRLDPGDYLTVAVDQVGSTVAGSDLVVNVRVRRR